MQGSMLSPSNSLRLHLPGPPALSSPILFKLLSSLIYIFFTSNTFYTLTILSIAQDPLASAARVGFTIPNRQHSSLSLSCAPSRQEAHHGTSNPSLFRPSR